MLDLCSVNDNECEIGINPSYANYYIDKKCVHEHDLIIIIDIVIELQYVFGEKPKWNLLVWKCLVQISKNKLFSLLNIC